MNSLLGEFGIAVLSATHAHCTVAVRVHCIPYFIYYNPQKPPLNPFSRKPHASKQNEKGILVNSSVKMQYFVGLSPLLVYVHSLVIN